MKKIEIQCRLRMLEDFHIGTGVGSIGLYDEGQYKDKGLASVPLSTFKGILRESGRQIRRYHKAFGDGLAESYAVLYDRIFRSHDDLHSLDIQISPEDEAPNNVIHYFTAVDPACGMAKAGSLRAQEFGAKSLSFKIKLSYYCADHETQEIIDFLKEALQNIKTIGGYRRRGFGALEILDIDSRAMEIEGDKETTPNGSKLRIVLKLLEDTLISAKAQSGNLMESNDYIPGSTILGMLRAKLMIQRLEGSYLDDDSVKAEFFYPLPEGADAGEAHQVLPVFFNLRRKKEYGRASGDLKKLPVWALRNPHDSNLLKGMICENTLKPPKENGKPSKGMYEGYIYSACSDDVDMAGQAKYYTVNKTIYQRNSIDPRTQSTGDDGIFIENRIAKGTLFSGCISFKDDDACADFCRDFSPWLSGANNLNLGRGAKACHIVSYEPESSDRQIQIEDSFSISFLSDVILFDDQLLPVRQFDEKILVSLLSAEFSESDFSLKGRAERCGVISSFSGTTGLRKFRDIAIRKGSSYLFEIKSKDKKQKLAAELQDLEAQGIGIRKHEGFGAIAINHPITNIEARMDSDTKMDSLTEICAKTSPAESERIGRKNKIHVDADELCDEFKKHKRSEKWRNTAGWIIGIISENPDRQNLNEALKKKLKEKESAKDSGQSWGEEDFRRIMTEIILQKEMDTESVRIALHKLPDSKGDKNG